MPSNLYSLRTGIEQMDLMLIHENITNSYWAKGISFSLLAKALKNSLCFGLFQENKQLAFARVITDKATFAYLADVFVIESERGKGLSKQLMKWIVEAKELQGLRRMLLATADAHGLYQHFGFEALTRPEIFMEKWQPTIYQ